MEVKWLLAIVHLLGMAIGVGSVWARGRALAGTLDKPGISHVLRASATC